MKPLAWLLTPVLVFLLAVPLAISLGIAAVTTPAVASTTCLTSAQPTAAQNARRGIPATGPSGGPTPVTASTSVGVPSAGSLPPPGAQRRVSLNNPPSPIPADVQALYVAAAARCQLPWTLLAGIGMEETNHGRLTATSGAHDGPDGIRRALYAYNPTGWYLNDVLYYAAAYTGDDITSLPCVTLDTTTGGSVPVVGAGTASGAINAALAWVGTPYSWGGGTASGPTTGICCSPGGQDARNVVGFDCSGLVLYAYAQIGISLPHLAHDIAYNSGGQVIPRDFNQMKPGDAIGFSYTPGGHVFHIGLYLGDGRMLNSDSHGVSIATLTADYYSNLAWRIVRFVN